MEVVWPFDFQSRFGYEALKRAADMDACPKGKVLERLRWGIRLKDDRKIEIIGGRAVPIASEAAPTLRLATGGDGEGLLMAV